MTTNEIAKRDQQDLATVPFTWRTLQAIARTEFVPDALRGRPDAMLAAIMFGREIGVGPMRSLQEIDIVQGRPTPSASLLTGLIRKAGHRIRPGKISNESAEAIGERLHADGTVSESWAYTFTLKDAETAGLVGKQNWQNYPAAMLYWRAVTFVARTMFSDCIGGLKYTPDELGDTSWHPPADATLSDDEPEVADLTPQEPDPVMVVEPLDGVEVTVEHDTGRGAKAMEWNNYWGSAERSPHAVKFARQMFKCQNDIERAGVVMEAEGIERAGKLHPGELLELEAYKVHLSELQDVEKA